MVAENDYPPKKLKYHEPTTAELEGWLEDVEIEQVGPEGKDRYGCPINLKINKNTPRRYAAWHILMRKYCDWEAPESVRLEAARVLYDHIAPVRILHMQMPAFYLHETLGKVACPLRRITKEVEELVFNLGRKVLDIKEPDDTNPENHSHAA